MMAYTPEQSAAIRHIRRHGYLIRSTRTMTDGRVVVSITNRTTGTGLKLIVKPDGKYHRAGMKMEDTQ